MAASPSELDDPKEVSIKLLVIGDHHVGKTTLINRVCKGRFEANLLATIGMDFHTHTWIHKGHPSGTLRIKAEFTDIQGQDYKPHVQRFISKGSKAVLVVTSYPLDQHSLETAGEWMKAAQQALLGTDNVKYYILVNKSDLVDSDAVKQSDEMVRKFFLPSAGATKENRSFDPSNIVGWIHTSAKSGTNLPKAVTNFVGDVANTIPEAELRPPASVPDYNTLQKKKRQDSGCRCRQQS